MFKNLFANQDLYKKFYETEKDFLISGSIASRQLYEIRDLLNAEQEEVNSPEDSKIPNPYWLFYYWVGDALTILDNYGGHPFQPKDESYNGRGVKRSAKALAKMGAVFSEIKTLLNKRGWKYKGEVLLQLDQFEKFLKEKINKSC